MFTYRLFNDDILLFESPCEQRHESATELGAHGDDGKEEVRMLTTLQMIPHTMFVNPTARYNTVYVRMVEQIGSPRMEDGSHAGCESLLGSKSINSSPCSLEHTVVELPLVSHRYRMQTVGQRENDMEVPDRDDFFPAELNPLLTLLLLALGTMTVSAAVVADMYVPTFGTYLYMPAQGTGTALRHVSEGSLNCRYDMMLAKELSTVASDNLTDVETCPHRLGGNRTSMGRTSFCGSM
jgi:hypothetical protein